MLICVGYKWFMGLYSIGLVYYGLVFDDGLLVEENWIDWVDSYDFCNLVNY